MRLSEQLTVLLESRGGKVLNKFPAGTWFPLYGGFGSWGGRVAMVIPRGEFDPETQSVSYDVWLGVTVDGKKVIPFRDAWRGTEPDIQPRNVSFEKTRYFLSTGPGYGPKIEGTFLRPKTIAVKKKMSDFDMSERATYMEWLRNQGLVDVSFWKIGKADWTKALKMSFADVQEKFHWDKANKFDEFMRRIDRDYDESDEKQERLWKSVRGVYAETQKGDLKFVIKRR